MLAAAAGVGGVAGRAETEELAEMWAHRAFSQQPLSARSVPGLCPSAWTLLPLEPILSWKFRNSGHQGRVLTLLCRAMAAFSRRSSKRAKKMGIEDGFHTDQNRPCKEVFKSLSEIFFW